MSYLANIDHFSKHPDSADDSFSCPSGAAYRHSDPAYYHLEADSACYIEDNVQLGWGES